jgi:hypothetical protein
MNFELISEIVKTLLFAVSAIWGMAVSFKKRGALFLQIVACGLCCMALGSIFVFSLNITAPEALHEQLLGGFNLGLLGTFGLFAFLFSASFGQIDGLGDDRSASLRKYRLLALIAPAVAILVLAAIVFSGIQPSMRIIYMVLFLPSILASYYNLKHLIIPDVELGILASIRAYNLVVLIMTLLVLIGTAAQHYGLAVCYGILNILTGISAPVVFYFAKKGTEGWLK